MNRPPDRIGNRVNLTLPGEVVAVLDRLGAVTGQPRATLIREWLEQAAPLMAEMARALEMAKTQQADALGVLGNVVRGVRTDVEQLEMDVRSSRRRAVRRKSPR